VLISASPLTERDGSFKGVLTVVFDITERRQAVRISVKVATCFGLKVATHRSVATRAFKLTKSGNFASSFSDISGLFSAF
jgi:hypothetical protein